MFKTIRALFAKKPVVVESAPVVVPIPTIVRPDVDPFATAKTSEPTRREEERLAMVWGTVVSVTGGRFYARKVVYESNAKNMVDELRGLGIPSGWDRDFTGKRESTDKQWAALWAYASSVRKARNA